MGCCVKRMRKEDCEGLGCGGGGGLKAEKIYEKWVDKHADCVCVYIFLRIKWLDRPYNLTRVRPHICTTKTRTASAGDAVVRVSYCRLFGIRTRKGFLEYVAMAAGAAFRLALFR